MNIGGENRGDGESWMVGGREGEGTARRGGWGEEEEEGHYIHGREKARIHAKVPTLRSLLLLRHTRHCNPLSIYTRIYIYIYNVSNVRENHLIEENPSKMGRSRKYRVESSVFIFPFFDLKIR